jgi:hypothetical protein
MASDEKFEQEHPAIVPIDVPLDLLRADDRLVVLERDSDRLARHLSQLEGALFNQMLAISVLEVAFAIFLACVIWVEYRRTTEKGVPQCTST